MFIGSGLGLWFAGLAGVELGERLDDCRRLELRDVAQLNMSRESGAGYCHRVRLDVARDIAEGGRVLAGGTAPGEGKAAQAIK